MHPEISRLVTLNFLSSVVLRGYAVRTLILYTRLPPFIYLYFRWRFFVDSNVARRSPFCLSRFRALEDDRLAAASAGEDLVARGGRSAFLFPRRRGF